MSTNKALTEDRKAEPRGAIEDAEPSVQVKILQVPARREPITAAPSPATAVGIPKGGGVSAQPKATPASKGPQPPSSTGAGLGPQPSSPSVMVISSVLPQKATFSQVTSVNQAATPGRTVVITVPRAAAPQPVAVPPRLPQTAAPQLPANIHLPAGMMLIRSDSGQLMLVSQQALAQAQQGSRGVSVQVPRILAPQVSAAAGNKSNEKVTVIRMAAPSTLQAAPVQKTAVVKVIGVAPKQAVVQNLSAVSEPGSQPHIQAVTTEARKELGATFSQEMLESVKKCKNFLVTLIKLASSDSRSASIANNVRGLIRNLLEGKLEAEEFTEQLYRELKSTPQPCLVPFLKKSLPAVRHLTSDSQLFIQQASTSTHNPNTLPSTMKQSGTDAGLNFNASQQMIQQPRGAPLQPGLMTLGPSRNCISKSSRPTPKHIVIQSGKHLTGSFSVMQSFTQDPRRSTKFILEDDDINDVASMAGVNLREENTQILNTMVGSVVQSCQDQPFLSHPLVLRRILHTGRALGVTDVGPEVVALVSHAAQECLRELLEKLSVMAEHRKAVLKEDLWHVKVSDVRSQLRFLEDLESLKKKRKDEEERQRLLQFARSRSHTEDPQHQQLKQRAKQLQQIEEAQLQQREANITALAAIGPRKKRSVEQTDSQVTLLPTQAIQRVTRVMLRDLLVCMEQDLFLRRSLTLYKAMI